MSGVTETAKLADALQEELDHLRICLSLAEEKGAPAADLKAMRSEIAALDKRLVKLRRRWQTIR